jgi:ABC-type transport system involved in Fe-S cluster assembly fused permease/ATPase subunit
MRVSVLLYKNVKIFDDESINIGLYDRIMKLYRTVEKWRLNKHVVLSYSTAEIFEYLNKTIGSHLLRPRIVYIPCYL